jgi:hypothetical protein
MTKQKAGNFPEKVLALQVGDSVSDSGAGWFPGCYMVDRTVQGYTIALCYVETDREFFISSEKMEEILKYNNWKHDSVFSVLDRAFGGSE